MKSPRRVQRVVGSMVGPVVAYGLALGTMAVRATALGRVAALGAGFWVMATYVGAQALLVRAVLTKDEARPRSTPLERSGPQPT